MRNLSSIKKWAAQQWPGADHRLPIVSRKAHSVVASAAPTVAVLTEAAVCPDIARARRCAAGGVRTAADSYVISRRAAPPLRLPPPARSPPPQALARWQPQPAALRPRRRYLDDPLLVCRKKFDIRMYVLVTSFRPLRAWVSDLAFCRFCTALYVRDDLENTFVHLTNVAIQKHGDAYNDKHGSKWPLRCLRQFLEGTRGREATERLFERIRGVVVHSLRAVQRNMINDRHCFELYGYDLLIDADLKPWLIEA